MHAGLTTSYPRVWSLSAGRALVVTDIHGDWAAYQLYRDYFLQLHAQGQASYLIFTGDLIHAHSAALPDRSLEIVLDVLALRERYGNAIICLCGNHELPHIYGLRLSKGANEYTPGFEAALSASGQRQRIMDFFTSLPFYIRTAAGVSITHAGASHATLDPGDVATIWNLNHHTTLSRIDALLPAADRPGLRTAYARMSGNLSYANLAQHYLAVSGPDDPRYDDLMRGFMLSSLPEFRLVRTALFTRCEHDYGSGKYAHLAYSTLLTALLSQLSQDFAEQHFLVAGHIGVTGGHQVVAERHLRLASAAHARPREAGQCLLLDTAQPITQLDQLIGQLHCIMR